ncbi:MAG: LysR family transcriptional regulator [Alphaproteobacteria bacterium]|nr:LysR family transcriptional regulator [Alphaproteobacteria bacterium]
MNYNDIKNLEGIFALRAVYVCGGKKKAAEAMNSSVDTVGKHISQLEANLNVKLVKESKTACSLTPEGMRVLEAMKSLDTIWEKICYEKNAKKDVSGTVTIGLATGISTYFFPENIMDFIEKFPLLRLELLQIKEKPKSDDAMYDITISYAPFETGDMVPIFKKELKCGYFVSARYLAKYGYPKDFDDLIKNHRIVCKKNWESYSDKYGDALDDCKKIVTMTDLSSILLYMVQYGAGICVAPLIFKEEGAVCLDNIPCDTVFTVYLSAHRSVKDTPKVRTVIDYCKDLISKMVLEE